MTATHIVDWTADTDADLFECLADYSAPLAADPTLIETPNGAQLRAYCEQIAAEFARRNINIVLHF